MSVNPIEAGVGDLWYAKQSALGTIASPGSGSHAEGGKIPVTFGGRCLTSGASPAVTVVAKTGAGGAYV